MTNEGALMFFSPAPDLSRITAEQSPLSLSVYSAGKFRIYQHNKNKNKKDQNVLLFSLRQNGWHIQHFTSSLTGTY